MTTVAVTVGDPAGIGPEITRAALEAALGLFPSVRFLVFGPSLSPSLRTHPRVDHFEGEPFTGPLGAPSAASGRISRIAVDQAIASVKSGRASALVTAPISKMAWHLAGYSELGHTPVLDAALGTTGAVMSFWGSGLRVALCTEHLPLAQVPGALRVARIVAVAAALNEALTRYEGIARPRLALAALNPHAGEAGALGDEEQTLLRPSVEMSRAAGVDIQGPFPADTLFAQAREGRFDGVVALYHDQALIPVKLFGLGSAVHVTLGLTVVRTSPDHGTAFDRVGHANPEGMIAACTLACRWSAAADR